jgi:dihydroxyacetone kinase
MDFQTLVNLGRATSTHMASVAAALDHCHVPGRTGEWQIPEGRMEIGLGLHNETVSYNRDSDCLCFHVFVLVCGNKDGKKKKRKLTR